LLTGEYFVLDGAKAFAIPVRMGQWMHLRESVGSEVVWNSHDRNGEVWFSAKFDLLDFDVISTNDDALALTLRQILKAASRLNSDFLSKWKKYRIDTYLEFSRTWGLGSSSTLISCMAQWADVNPYILLFNTLGGSGYDVACAQAEGPIVYQLGDNELHISHVDFEPNFADNLYFVYLGQKTDSAEARRHYYKHRASCNGALKHISDITEEIHQTKNLHDFEQCLLEHEKIISTSLHLKTVKDELFGDFWGVVKSLGAWGGDFVLATSDRDPLTTKSYFRDHGLNTIFIYEELFVAQPV
jgi:mevalonate kinase